jgi:STE24 endopeptidase
VTRGRRPFAAGALLALLLLLLAAAGAFAASKLLYTTVPHGLRLGGLDPGRYFTPAQLRHGESTERFIAITALLAELASLAALAVYALRGERLMSRSAAGRIGTGIMLALLGLAMAGLARLPFDLAQLWWLRSHHIEHPSYLGYILSQWLTLGGGAVFIALAIAIVMGIAGRLRRTWWLAAVPVFAAMSLLAAFVSPYLIPDTHELGNPQLRAATRALAKADGLPANIRVLVQSVHGSTTQPNAESTGIGPTRTIVLWDTLTTGGFTIPEIRAVIAHELGHAKRNHVLKEVGWFALFSFLIAGSVALATRGRGGMREPRAVPVALLVYAVLQLAVLPLHNAVTRRYEREADWIALSTTHDPATQRAMLVRLAVQAQADPDPPAWEYLLFDDHPTIAQRIALANGYAQRQQP